MKDESLQLLGSFGKIAGENLSKIAAGLQSLGPVSMVPLAAPYLLTFYVLYRRIFKRALNRLNQKTLNKELLNLDQQILQVEKRNEELGKSIEMLQHDLDSGLQSGYYQTILEQKIKEFDQSKSIYDDLVARVEFVKNLELLLERKKYLAQRGVWSTLNKVSKKNIEALDKEITEKSIDSALLKDYLKDLNTRQDFYDEIMKVEVDGGS